ncbi:MAG TPA: single-stranded DNA-binding protein [Streptosporangiaceae bacterium]|nr:single-stranded DNA-binding protein [Streptosporangiaceae bacterium]
MLNEAQISLTGYVATQPVTRLVKPGVSNVSMRVAWTPRRQDRATGEWVDGNTSYVTVICWRKLGANVAICLRTGDPVVVKGKLSVRTYDDKDGVRRTSVDVEASSVGHDLSRGVSQFQRVRPQTGMTAAEFQAAKAAGAQDGRRDQGAGPDGGAGQDGRGDQGGGQDGGAGGGDRADQVGMARGTADPAGIARPAAEGSWAAGDADMPMPDEPERGFFDESAISEHSTAEEPAAVS